MADTKNMLSKMSDEEFQEMGSEFPTKKFWNDNFYCLHENFWYPAAAAKGTLSFQKHFKARDTDLILISTPNSGTTWIKALAYAIVHRSDHPNSLKDSPLLTKGPHDLVLFFELDLYLSNPTPNLDIDFDRVRVFATHVPYSSLPASITDSKCRIVYVCRNPVDQFISNWHFFSNIFKAQPQVPLPDFFELFCNGVSNFGPFWDHVLGFWRVSLEKPDKVLFFKFEDMKKETYAHVTRLAEFCRVPFSAEEEKGGVVDEIMKLCSFQTMTGLEANKKGSHVTRQLTYRQRAFEDARSSQAINDCIRPPPRLF